MKKNIILLCTLLLICFNTFIFILIILFSRICYEISLLSSVHPVYFIDSIPIYLIVILLISAIVEIYFIIKFNKD